MRCRGYGSFFKFVSRNDEENQINSQHLRLKTSTPQNLVFMLPYFQFTTIHLGFITIQVWGLLVALGILVATTVAARKAKNDGLDPNLVWDFAFWVVFAAFIGARLFEVFYNPAFYFGNPIQLLYVWNGGLSEMGGFIGAAIALVWYLKLHLLDVKRYADSVAFALPLGFGIGRIGCFLIHDHPGTLTHFLLGVKYPDGIRHDHGLYLSIEGFLLFFFFVYLSKRGVKTGTYVYTFLIIHGIVRFFLDFLRIIDVRYLYLTPAQYMSILMIAFGIFLWRRDVRKNV